MEKLEAETSQGENREEKELKALGQLFDASPAIDDLRKAGESSREKVSRVLNGDEGSGEDLEMEEDHEREQSADEDKGIENKEYDERGNDEANNLIAEEQDDKILSDGMIIN